ncbi:MAG: phosphatidate cytidylyltransferase [Alphaproteobacteria bacterium]|nr:phosphatidate cytidylyltransferase [Alphaproteobacteria bacterium]
MQNEVRVRTISGVTLGIFVIVLTWFGGLGFRVLSIAIMVLVFFEWFRIVQTQSLSRRVWIIGSLTIALVGLCILAEFALPALALATAGAAITGIVRHYEARDQWPSAGLIYAGYFGVAFSELRDSGEYGFAVMIFLFAIIWSTDIFAFFGGRSLGGPKLAPAISPKKTWSGFLSGLIGGVIAGLIAASIFVTPHYLWIAFLSIVLSLSGQAGDLFESALKRRFQVKDSGDLIPGHGGVLDRVDSMIFAAFAAYVIGIAMHGDGIDGGGNGIAYQLLGQ